MFGDKMYGFDITVDHFLCASPTFLRWRKIHPRSKRIRKKWQKRYGAVMKFCEGTETKAIRVGRRMIMCPHLFDALKKQLGETK